MAIQLGILDRLESLDKLTRLGDPLATLAKIVPFTLFREELPTREPSPKVSVRPSTSRPSPLPLGF
jgi:hypothetical protein